MEDEQKQEEQPNSLAVAIANHLGVPVTEVHCYVLTVETASEEKGTQLHTVWPVLSTTWQIEGYLHDALRQVKLGQLNKDIKQALAQALHDNNGGN